MEFSLPLVVGASVGLVSYAILLRLAELVDLRRRKPDRGRRRPPVERLGGWLEAVPLPEPVSRVWSTTEAGEELRLAGLPWSAEGFAALRWLALCLAAGLVLLVLTRLGSGVLGGFTVLLLLSLGLYGPKLWLKLRAERRQREVEHALPDLLDRLTLGMEAGLGFEVALRRAAADFGSLLGVEIRRMVRMLDLGHTKADLMKELAQRMPSEDLRAFAAGVRQAERLGTSLAKTLRVQSQVMRARRRRRAQEASRRLPILVVFPLTFFFLPALLIIYLAPPLLHLFLNQ